MTSLYLVGAAAFSPLFPSLEAIASGVALQEPVRPNCDIVPSRIRRATSLLTSMSIATTHTALLSADASLSDTATVFASEHGELHIAVEQMKMMKEGSGVVSPARFKNSVHNTAAGLFSIATGNRGFTTALAAGPATAAAALFEALSLLQEGFDNVVLTVADEDAPDFLRPWCNHQALSVSLVFSTKKRTGSLAACLDHQSHVLAGKRRPNREVAQITHEAWNGHSAMPALQTALCFQHNAARDINFAPFELQVGP